jgi:hypothetical protein
MTSSGVDSSESKSKMKAVADVPAPFDSKMDIDPMKLARMWAVNAEAMHAIGAGFESVVGSINDFLVDNERTRKEAQLTRNVVLYAVIANILIGAVILFGISRSIDRAVDTMQSTVSSQKTEITKVQKTLDKKD